MSTAIGAGISGVFGEKPGSGVSAYDNIYSVHFDSPAQRINCGDSSSFSFPGTVASDRAFSISTWVYFVDTVNSVQICGKGDVGTANAEYNLETDSSGRVRIRLYDSNVSSTSTSYWQGRNNTVLEINKWYHIVATFDGTTPNAQSHSIRIYVNNQLNNVVTRVNTPGPFVQMFDNGGKFILGTTDGVNSKNIYMDEAAIFNRALTQADINYLYSIPFTPNLTVNGNFTELGSELILNGDFEDISPNKVIPNAGPSNTANLFTPYSNNTVEYDGSNTIITRVNDSSGGYAYLNSSYSIPGNLQVDKSYKISITFKVSSGGSVGWIFHNGINGQDQYSFGHENTEFITITKYINAQSAGGCFIRTYDLSGSVTISGYTVQEMDPNDRWTLGTGWTIANGKARRGGYSVNTDIQQNVPVVNGGTYKFSYTRGYESGDGQTNLYIKLDNVNYSTLGSYSSTVVEEHTVEGYFTTTFTGNLLFRIFGINDFTGTIDNVSVKEISGWTFGDGWSVNSSNQAEYDGTGTTASALEQTVATYEDGKKYQVQFQLDGSLNGVAVSINGGTAVNALRSTTDNSSRSVTVIAGSGSNSLKITPLDATDTFTISDITSKLVTSLAAPNTDKDDARAVDLTGMSDLDHWWRMGDTQGPATYPVIHDVVYNPFGEELVENGSFDELGPQAIKNPLFGLGPEEVTNGDFDTDSDWFKAPSGVTIIGGSANFNSASDTYVYQDILTATKTYKVIFSGTINSGSFYIGENGVATNIYTAGTYTNEVAYFTVSSSARFIIRKTGLGTLDASIDNVSVKELPHWSLQEGWSIENGFAVQDGTNTSYSSIQQSNVTTSTKIYKVSIDIDEVSGPVELKGSGVYTRLDTLGVGSHVVYITADASYIRVLAFAGSKIKFKDFFVEQVDPEDDWTVVDSDTNNYVEFTEGFARLKFLNTSPITKLETSTQILQANQTYKLVVDVYDVTSGEIKIDGSGIQEYFNTEGVTTRYITPTGNTPLRFYRNTANVDITLASVSVQQVSDTSGIMENMNPDNIVAFSPPDPDPLVGDEFIFSVNTAQSGVSNSNQFQLPLISSGTLDFTVIWGDGTQDIITSYNQAETLHTYPSSGTYTIGIRANTEPLKGFKFDSGGDKLKMSNIVNWGGSNFRLDQQEAFYGCANMTCTATDAPLITATVFYRMFRGCSNFNGDLSNWDVSDVNSFNQMFFSCNAFTGKGLENWDISSVDQIEYMFFNCPNFNGQIGGWDTSGVTNMRYVFQQCTIFNQDISSWNTSLVTQMTSMFRSAAEFNQPLNSWDVSSCTKFANMFRDAIKFNQPLNNWTIKNDAEVDMNAMFYNANAFNQDISMWDVSRVRYMQYMFYSCADMSFGFDGWDTSSVDNFIRFAGDTNVLDTSFGYLDISSALQLLFFKSSGQTISTENYNNTLIGWAAQTVNPNLTTSFGSATYSYSAFDARNTLTSAPNNWLITDGGYVPTDNAFQFTVNPNLQTLGSELNDLTWGAFGGWSIVDGVASNDGSGSTITNEILEIGKTYKITVQLSTYTSGNFSVFLGNGTESSQFNGTDEFTFYGVCSGDAYARVKSYSGIGSINLQNISVKEVLSDTNQFELPLVNQGTQNFVVDWGDGTQDKITAWDDAAKLHSYYTYGSELVTNGDFALNSSWLNFGTPTTSEQSTEQSHTGTYSWKIIADATQEGIFSPNNFNLTSGLTYSVSLWIYSVSGNSIKSGLTNTNQNVFTERTVTVGKWTNITYIATASSTGAAYVSILSQNSLNFFVDNVSVVEQTPDTTPKTISIDGTIQGWQFDAPGDYLKLNNINRWGALDIQSNAMFYRCANMTCTATDAPTVSTTSFYRMFRDCTNFNGAIGNWDVSGVTRMDEFLKGCSNFNQPLNDWDVSNVNVFAQMFNSCTNFVQDLNDWQINNSEIVNMYAMFYNCANFNGDIYSWDTSTVWNMALMFYNCDSFDQSLATWNVESVTNFGDVNLGFMRLATGLSTSNYNLTLVSWAHQNVNSGLSLDFGGSQYSAGGAAEASRNILTSAPNNWTISDGGSV
jgi:surface protein